MSLHVTKYLYAKLFIQIDFDWLCPILNRYFYMEDYLSMHLFDCKENAGVKEPTVKESYCESFQGLGLIS